MQNVNYESEGNLDDRPKKKSAKRSNDRNRRHRNDKQGSSHDKMELKNQAKNDVGQQINISTLPTENNQQFISSRKNQDEERKIQKITPAGTSRVNAEET